MLINHERTGNPKLAGLHISFDQMVLVFGAQHNFRTATGWVAIVFRYVRCYELGFGEAVAECMT